jgi:hypothetical protein
MRRPHKHYESMISIPSGVDRSPPKSPGVNGPPIDHLCMVGSPVKAIATTDSAAANSAPKLYAWLSPDTAKRRSTTGSVSIYYIVLLWEIAVIPLLGRKPWLAAALRPGHGPLLSVLVGAMNWKFDTLQRRKLDLDNGVPKEV